MLPRYPPPTCQKINVLKLPNSGFPQKTAPKGRKFKGNIQNLGGILWSSGYWLPLCHIYIYQSSDRCNFTNQICSKTCRYLSSRENSLLFMRLLLCWRCSLTKTAVFMSARGVHQRKHRWKTVLILPKESTSLPWMIITHGSVSKPGTASEHQNSWDLWMWITPEKWYYNRYWSIPLCPANNLVVWLRQKSLELWLSHD
jgi:hypothetical protein